MGIEFKDDKPDNVKKYEDENPRKDYQDFRKDNPKDNFREESRKISSGKSKPHFLEKESVQAKKQELISHVQNFQETFSNHELKVWKEKLKALSDELA